MPFDPVRDAVANSPLNTSFPLPTPFSPTPTNQFPFPPVDQPPPQKRTSNLSMLLNGPAEPPLKIQRLANLLSPQDQAQPLPFAPSSELQRPSTSSSTSSLGSSHLRSHPLRNSFEPPASPERHQQPAHWSTSSLSPENRPRPMSQSPVFTHAHPRQPLQDAGIRFHPNSISDHHGTPPFATTTIPKLAYNPVRKTPASSVLKPLTNDDARSLVSQNRLRFIDRSPGSSSSSSKQLANPRPDYAGTNPMPAKGDNGSFNTSGTSSYPAARPYDHPQPHTAPAKRRLGDRGDDHDGLFDDEDEHSRPYKKSRDSGLVAYHYNARPEVGRAMRQDSPIIGLKSFNNWIKSVLISKYALPVFRNSLHRQHPQIKGRRPPSCGRVLDMGCGKGGDLQKWAKANIRELVGLDIAAVSIDQARSRWQEMQSRPVGRFDGFFAPLDCYNFPLSTVLSPEQLSRPFDVVSMQFCMHYAFDAEAKVRMMLENVSSNLRNGGVFIGTTPNADLLMERLDGIPSDATELSFGNSVYRFKFDDRIRRVYGQRYYFYLKDAVEDVPEYLVHWPEFEKLALEYDLHCICRIEFHDLFDENREIPEFRTLLQRMRVVDEKGESHIDEDQWEAANIYLAFAFRKGVDS